MGDTVPKAAPAVHNLTLPGGAQSSASVLEEENFETAHLVAFDGDFDNDMAKLLQFKNSLVTAIPCTL